MNFAYNFVDASRLHPVDMIFWSQVDRRGDCWIWLGRTDRGYGMFYGHRAYRVAYELVNKREIGKKQLHHVCGVRLCVNPSHLDMVDKQEHSKIHARGSYNVTTH